LASAYNKEAYYIRRLLTETAIRASDKRARFVGVTAYEAAGGIVMRDLFEQDNGGWLQDSALLDRLAIAKLTSEAEALRAEGWKWIEVALEFPYGHAAGLRRLTGTAAEVSAEERARHEALSEEFDRLNEEYSDADTDDLPEEVARRLDELEAELQAFADRPEIYDTADIARAGVAGRWERAAAMYTLIATAKLNDIDPQAWLADVLRRIADHPASRIHELLPWHWKKPADQAFAA